MGRVFAGFDDRTIPVPTAAGRIRAWVGGDGPPVLLLHGYPQTRTMWHRVAPDLARRHTLVIPDLRGYGQSGAPEPDPGARLYSKREMAADQVAVMDALGFDRFAVVGHDRGGRVGHRMARDHRDRVTRLSVLDIVPTRTLFRGTDQAFATAYWHWFFLIQTGGLPERMIGADPGWFVREILTRWSADVTALDPRAVDEYIARFTPPVIAASCADYRAASGVDLEHDDADADAPLEVPLQVLWGAAGAMARLYDVLGTWRAMARHVGGHAIDGGHFPAEESPAATLAALTSFLG
ncbi:MAG: alpha/beta hydrolase [Thermoleophilia bacterium]|nr:alpha/beta hydrolase [Thermoleophilia bacterium]